MPSSCSHPRSWRASGDLLQRPGTVEQHRAGLLAGREDEEAHGVVERVQQPARLGVDEREAKVEAAVRERKPREPEAQLALAAAPVPAQRTRVLRRGPEHEAAVVAQLE